MKVVFHLDEEEKWPLTLVNVGNFLQEMPDATIEIVAYAAAVTLYGEKNPLPEELVGKVDFVGCGNALRKFGLDPENLPEGVRAVPSGVVEIACRQKDGYAYIRP